MLKNSLEIISKIESYGYEAYIVGGMVRDYYMNKASNDIDICTSAKPKDLINIFDSIKLPKEKYGAVTLYYKNIRYEITTFRKELRYENRRPIELEYTNNFYEDLVRRDFTINTLCMNSKGEIIDTFNGKNDIDKKIVRCVGDANKKFNDDPLRMLRAVRFATILNFKLDINLENAIKNNAYLLKDISYYRKKEELNKIFTSTNAKYGIKLLCTLDMNKYLELGNLNKIKITSDILGIWAELNNIDNYPFSKLEIDTINDVREILKNKKIDKYEIYRYGLYNSTIAGEILGISKKSIIKIDKSLVIHSRSAINITVDEICKILNKKPDKWLKDILIDIEYKIIYSKLKNDNLKIREYIIKNY